MEKLKNNIIKFINKENYLKTKLIIACILAGILSIIFEYKFYTIYIDGSYDSKTRMLIMAGVFFFVLLHFVFKLNDMYEFIHKQRYKLAAGFIVFVMIFKLSGSSIVNYNDQFQTESDDNRFHTLLGYARMIRTDEWASSTLYMLSQGVGQNQYEYFSNKLRGTTTDMFTLTNSPVKDILMIGKPFQIMFLLLGNDYGLSFYWYIRLVAMMLGAYELCLLLTDRKKLISLCGMMMITFSAAVQWWYCMDTLIWGQIILVLLNKFMETDKKYVKYLCGLRRNSCYNFIYFYTVSGLASFICVCFPSTWNLDFYKEF